MHERHRILHFYAETLIYFLSAKNAPYIDTKMKTFIIILITVILYGENSMKGTYFDVEE